MRCSVVHIALLSFAVLLTIALAYADKDDDSVASDGQGELVDALDDKRGTLMRYGRGSIFRYGKRGSVFRYGKRGSVFRYGKREDDNDYYQDDMDSAKRVFRYGKRDGDDIDFKRLFRYGKRADDDVVDYPELEEKRGQVFRYGKRADIDDLLEEAKRRIFRYGREIRGGQNTPHVPFRFGERE